MHVRQVPGERHRRWFSSTDLDLVTWHEVDGRIAAFQLCYDKTRAEHALTWREDRTGISHSRVDDGEAWPLSHKATPVLLPDGEWDAVRVLAHFRAEAADLPADVVARIDGVLAGAVRSP